LITRLEQLQTISDVYKSKLDSLNNQIENLQSKNTELEVLLKNYLTQIF
jgi:prefoldin subunit 5